MFFHTLALAGRWLTIVQIRVLYQMTQFIMMNSEKLREKMAEQKDADRDHTVWVGLLSGRQTAT